MHILELPPLWESLPPKGYGAIEYLVSKQIEGYIANGHQVTTYASGDSNIDGNLIPICEKSLNNLDVQDPEIFRIIQFQKALENANQYDLIHCHLHSNSGWLGLPMLEKLAHKTIFSLHTFANNENRKLVSLHPHCKFIAASKSHAESYKSSFVSEFVYHGICLDEFDFLPCFSNPTLFCFFR